MKEWYEVLEGTPEGTYTLEIFETLKQARKFKRMELKKDKTRELHIDKWRNPDSPEILEAIE